PLYRSPLPLLLTTPPFPYTTLFRSWRKAVAPESPCGGPPPAHIRHPVPVPTDPYLVWRRYPRGPIAGKCPMAVAGAPPFSKGHFPAWFGHSARPCPGGPHLTVGYIGQKAC